MMWGFVFVAVFLLQFVAPMIYRTHLEPYGSSFAYVAFQWVNYLSFGAITFALMATITLDVLHRARRFWMKPFSESRRRWITQASPYGAITLAGGAYLTGLAGALGPMVPRVDHVEVPIDDLPAGLDGLRIAQLSDLHVGPTIGVDYAERVRERTQQLDADLIALTGDFVDGEVGQIQHRIEPITRLRARLGVFFVTGNHEYYWGARQWTDFWQSKGFFPLINSHHVVEHQGASFVIAGVQDYSAARFGEDQRSDPALAFSGAPSASIKIPRLLLAHQPKSCFDTAGLGVDLQLSGHTHAGQYFPATFLVRLVQPYVSGLNRHGAGWVYVNRGTGYWGPPLRLGAPAEITLLTLRRASKV